MENNKEEKGKIKINLISVIVITISLIIIVVAIILSISRFKCVDYIDGFIDTQTGKEDSENKENSIKIRYAYAYNIPTADSLNELEEEKYIEILELQLEGEQLDNINNILKNLSFKKADLSEYKYTNLAIAVAGMYELTINNEIVLLLDYGSKWAHYTKGEESYIIECPEKLVNEIHNIVQKRVNTDMKKYSADKITIISNDNKKVEISDKKHIEILTENLKFSKVNMSDDDMKDEKIIYTVDLNNGTKIQVYHASSVGCIIENNNKYYIAFITDYDNIAKTMYENYISGRNETLNTNEIKIEYLGKEYVINDKKDVEFIIENIKLSDYFLHDWLEDFGEEDYTNEDIVVTIANSKIIIPGSINLGNRYYIDENNKAYLVSLKPEAEKKIKEITGYKQ